MLRGGSRMAGFYDVIPQNHQSIKNGLTSNKISTQNCYILILCVFTESACRPIQPSIRNVHLCICVFFCPPISGRAGRQSLTHSWTYRNQVNPINPFNPVNNNKNSNKPPPPKKKITYITTTTTFRD